MAVGALIVGYRHGGSALTGNELVAAHSVIFLDQPPAFLNVAAVVQRPVLIAGGKRVFLAAQQESGERANLFLGEGQGRHSQLFRFRVVLSLVPNVPLWPLVFVEAPFVLPSP